MYPSVHATVHLPPTAVSPHDHVSDACAKGGVAVQPSNVVLVLAVEVEVVDVFVVVVDVFVVVVVLFVVVMDVFVVVLDVFVVAVDVFVVVVDVFVVVVDVMPSTAHINHPVLLIVVFSEVHRTDVSAKATTSLSVVSKNHDKYSR